MKRELTHSFKMSILVASLLSVSNGLSFSMGMPAFNTGIAAVVSISGAISQRVSARTHRHSKNKTRTRVVRHRIRRGDSITSIARKYRISRTKLIRNNRLRRPYRLRLGRSLYIKKIRINAQRRVVIRSSKRHSRRKKRGVRKVVQTVRVRTYRHRVRRGETVRSIARGYRVSRRQIIRLNHLRRPYRVRRGRVLVIKRVRTVSYRKTIVAGKPRRNAKLSSNNRQARHETKTNIKNSGKRKQGRNNKSHLTKPASKKLTAKKSHKYKPPRKTQPIRVRTYMHRIRRGDNLRRLSKRYGVSQGQIIRLNRLRHPYRLRPGRRLVIKKVMIRAGHDEFKLGNKSDWQEISPGKAESAKIASKSRNSHKYNVNIKKPSTIKGNRLNHLKNKRAASKGTGTRNTRRHIATSGTSQRRVINRRVEKVDEKNGFMRGVGRWIWPANGRLDSRFSRSSKGIKISGRLGQGIYAAAKGKIVYIGDSLIRYGNLVIIKHNNIYFTAYAHNQRLLVREGQFVKRGQKIAEMGSASSGKIVLHFEIRKDGRPVDPLRYLPRK